MLVLVAYNTSCKIVLDKDSNNPEVSRSSAISRMLYNHIFWLIGVTSVNEMLLDEYSNNHDDSKI